MDFNFVGLLSIPFSELSFLSTSGEQIRASRVEECARKTFSHIIGVFGI
jgi:hypothetical protein